MTTEQIPEAYINLPMLDQMSLHFKIGWHQMVKMWPLWTITVLVFAYSFYKSK